MIKPYRKLVLKKRKAKPGTQRRTWLAGIHQLCRLQCWNGRQFSQPSQWQTQAWRQVTHPEAAELVLLVVAPDLLRFLGLEGLLCSPHHTSARAFSDGQLADVELHPAGQLDWGLMDGMCGCVHLGISASNLCHAYSPLTVCRYASGYLVDDARVTCGGLTMCSVAFCAHVNSGFPFSLGTNFKISSFD